MSDPKKDPIDHIAEEEISKSQEVNPEAEVQKVPENQESKWEQLEEKKAAPPASVVPPTPEPPKNEGETPPPVEPPEKKNTYRLPRLIFLGMVGAVALFILSFLIYISFDLPPMELIENPQSDLSTQVISADGVVLQKFYSRENPAHKSFPDQ